MTQTFKKLLYNAGGHIIGSFGLIQMEDFDNFI